MGAPRGVCGRLTWKESSTCSVALQAIIMILVIDNNKTPSEKSCTWGV
jgi:hypothetical protein